MGIPPSISSTQLRDSSPLNKGLKLVFMIGRMECSDLSGRSLMKELAWPMAIGNMN
jgi:hypothetical protein